jgi:hypothetical protein
MTNHLPAFGRTLGALIFAVLFLGTGRGAASAIQIPEKPQPNEPPRGAVLTSKDALFFAQHECRSLEPKPLTSWTPGPTEIARLEKVLPKFMAGQKTPLDYKPLHEYYRQYMGAVRDGKKWICVNFVHYDFVRECLERPHLIPVKKTVQKGGRAEEFWRHEPIVVMDGGASFFTVQFDVESGTFSALGFNGYA